MVPKDHSERMARARQALDGLSVGDAFGERFFVHPHVIESLLESRALPREPWTWTDDTAMALSVVEVLDDHGEIDRDALAIAFARRYSHEPMRGYGGTAHGILHAIGLGMPWQSAAGSVFGGEGSMGNGAAMRAAPVGAYFADDLDAVVEQADRSGQPTHAHPDGRAGAVAVAVGAALAVRGASSPFDPLAWLNDVLERTPESATRDGIAKAIDLPLSYDVRTAAAALGNGVLVISSDTVPLSLWCAARHMDDYEESLWTTVSALGDRDTTCAIVGGIVALRARQIPPSWVAAREALP